MEFTSKSNRTEKTTAFATNFFLSSLPFGFVFWKTTGTARSTAAFSVFRILTTGATTVLSFTTSVATAAQANVWFWGAVFINFFSLSTSGVWLFWRSLFFVSTPWFFMFEWGSWWWEWDGLFDEFGTPGSIILLRVSWVEAVFSEMPVVEGAFLAGTWFCDGSINNGEEWFFVNT